MNYLRTERGTVNHIRKFEKEGFVVRTICEHCNKKTGGLYGEAFKVFARQFAQSGSLITPGQRRAWISLKDIQPLRVIKQLGAMVLAAQPRLVNPDRWVPLQRFVLSRDRHISAEAGRFYLYQNVSGIGRVSAISGLVMLRQKKAPPLIFSEVSWPPLGLIYSLEFHPLLRQLFDVTDWGMADFRERRSFEFSVPKFRVEANWPFAFGTLKEAHDWIDRNLVMWYLWGDGGGDDPTQISTTVHRHTR